MSDERIARWRQTVDLITGSGKTQTDVANAVNASQSQVSRILTHPPKRATKLFDRLCSYALTLARRTQGPAEARAGLDRAVDEVWDGTDQHARALTAVIRSLKGLSAGTRGEQDR